MNDIIGSLGYGWLSILPPIVAMLLVITTRDVIFSLFIGIFTGAFIYEKFNIYSAVKTSFKAISNSISKDDSKINILIFLALLGALTIILTMSGGAKAYGDWAVKKIKTKPKAQLAACFLGFIFCIDDYFHFLASGVIMRPVIEKNRVSNEKLAYILDATAAPICVIMPISSWSAAVISIFSEHGIKNGMSLFVRTIPYNFYTILTIIVMLIFAINKFEFTRMAKFEQIASARELDTNCTNPQASEMVEGLPINKSGRVIYMSLPIIVLVVSTLICMLESGGYFNQNISIFSALETSDVCMSLVIGSFFALVSAFLIFIPMRIISFKNFTLGFVAGIKTMLVPFFILILAWSMSNICSECYLNTGAFIKETLSSTIQPQLFPITVFFISCFLSFATGTSWGTFGIFIPIIITLCSGFPERILIISIAATLAGSVFGDHVSPISDTTVLAATSAGCSYLDHVYTQMPYAITAAVISCVGYIIAGFFENLLLIWGICLSLLVVIIYMAKSFLLKKHRFIKNT